MQNKLFAVYLARQTPLFSDELFKAVQLSGPSLLTTIKY